MSSGDTVELYWATDKAYDPDIPVDGVYMLHDAAQTTPYPRPAIPSAVGSIVFLSDLPEPSFTGVQAGCIPGSVEVRVG